MRDIFLEVLRTSLLVSILIAGIIVTKDKFLSKYSYKFNYFLSLIVITRMLLVINIKLKVNIGDFTKESYTAYHEVIYNLTEAPVKNINTIDYTYIGMWIWFIGLIAVLLYYTYFQGKFYSKIKNSMISITEMKIEKILNKERKALNITKDIRVRIVNGISSPALIGLFRATIILPKQEFSNKELSLIFRHELIHFKRKDNIIKLLMILGAAIHWFNPLIYLFRKLFNEQCELSCDEKVISESKIEDIKEYALLLVKSAKHKNTLKISIMSSQLANKKINITKRRVENMLSLRSKKKGIVAGVVMLTVMGGTLFTLNTNKVLAVTNDETIDGVKLSADSPKGALIKIDVETGKILWYTTENEVVNKVHKGELALNDVEKYMENRNK
ncbi:M56 family metallopeptidase [Clostridium intestinale]|uniref:M56 family metallopeptidase n=1 Tax=Clostridium intestinale TaxID=36845 RepID=UPI0028EEAFDA|nr:M56 family metallopeptidase [Clostridium intestinale]